MSKKRESRFKGRVAKDAADQKREARGYGYLQLPEDVNIFKVDASERRSVINIMPYTVTEPHHPRNDGTGRAEVGTDWYNRPYKVHRQVGPENQNVVCPSSISKPCPICEYRSKQMQEGADKEITDALRPSLRNLYVVIPIDHKKYDEKPYIWDVSNFLFQKLLKDELDEKPQYEVFADLEGGFTLKVRWEEKTAKGNQFAQAQRIDFEKREEDYEESIMEDIPDLDAVLKILSYKELHSLFYQEEVEIDDDQEDNGGDEEETPPRKKKKAHHEENDDDDDKEGQKSKKKKHKKDEDGDEEKCPHDHKYGVDTEEYDDCDDCDLWKKCIKAKEEDE